MSHLFQSPHAHLPSTGSLTLRCPCPTQPGTAPGPPSPLANPKPAHPAVPPHRSHLPTSPSAAQHSQVLPGVAESGPAWLLLLGSCELSFLHPDDHPTSAWPTTLHEHQRQCPKHISTRGPSQPHCSTPKTNTSSASSQRETCPVEEVKGPAAGRRDGIFKERGTTDADSTPSVLQKGRGHGSDATHTRGTLCAEKCCRRRRRALRRQEHPQPPSSGRRTRGAHMERMRP